MFIDFPYKGYDKIASVEVPDENLIGVFEPKSAGEVDEDEILRIGFAEPFGAGRLRDEVKQNDKVLILIEDGTRGTPIPRLMPYVLEELRAAGISDNQITLLISPGTHRKMTDDELEEKLGEFYATFALFQHQWLDEENIREYGRTSDGTRVTANKLLGECDFVLGLGSIVPHRVKGFSGGAKIAFPGSAGREMQERNQWEASLRMSETVMGVAENPMRLRMEEAARIAGLSYIVNLVSDKDKKIAGCFCGDPVEAHRAGCRLSRQLNAARLPRRADIILADAHPADRDFWQSAKGFYSGTMAVKTGGSLIVVAPNPEGVAGNHPNLLEIGFRPQTEIIKMVEAGEIEDVIGAAILADVAQIVEKADCIMVSPGVGREEAEKIGLRYAETTQEALRMAFESQGAEAEVAVLKYGGHILPLVEEEKSEKETTG